MWTLPTNFLPIKNCSIHRRFELNITVVRVGQFLRTPVLLFHLDCIVQNIGIMKFQFLFVPIVLSI